MYIWGHTYNKKKIISWTLYNKTVIFRPRQSSLGACPPLRLFVGGKSWWFNAHLVWKAPPVSRLLLLSLSSLSFLFFFCLCVFGFIFIFLYFLNIFSCSCSCLFLLNLLPFFLIFFVSCFSLFSSSSCSFPSILLLPFFLVSYFSLFSSSSSLLCFLLVLLSFFTSLFPSFPSILLHFFVSFFSFCFSFLFYLFFYFYREELAKRNTVEKAVPEAIIFIEFRIAQHRKRNTSRTCDCHSSYLDIMSLLSSPFLSIIVRADREIYCF